MSSRLEALLMSRLSLGSFALALLLAVAFVAHEAPAQPKELDAAEKVRFETADGVKIQGEFYRSAVKGAPVVMMLHNIGESSAKEKWIDLAKTLQPTFSVLTFDFRGHGNSVEIDPELYFRYPANVRATKGASPKKTKLDWRDIDKNAYTLFINDIAAAKGYLERTKNDLGICNTANTFVIGVDQSATLAAIWANSEFHRYKFDFIPPFFQVKMESKAEGQNITGLVCLGISPKLGTRPVSLLKTLDYPCRQNQMPILLVHGDGDPKDKASLQDKETAKFLEKAIKIPLAGKKDDPKFAFTKAVELKNAGKLRGVDLLAKSLNTSQGINTYLKSLASEKANEWSAHEFAKSKYGWKVNPDPNELPIAAKVFTYETPFPPNPIFPVGGNLPETVDRNLAFDTYEIFVGR
ncbi:MAG: hypothetical protein WCL32_12225 [Planctomycetota bacterium]